MKKKVVSKLQLSKETLHNLADRDLAKVEGGASIDCTQSFSQYNGSCPITWRCCY